VKDKIPVGNVRVLVEVVDPVRIERRSASLDAVNLIILAK
jgi:hypothetical protein